jgi:site-specific DNA-methyltransferase (adenine-specific)
MIELYHGDCLEVMAGLPAGSVDLVLTDPPYGTTQCKWDAVIPFEPMWKQVRRVAKSNAAIVMTASQPFTSALVMSNPEQFRYCWVWEKNKATGHLNAKKRPLVAHEDVCVFYEQQPCYAPQGLVEKSTPTVSRGDRGKKGAGSSGECYGLAARDALQTHTGYPRSVQKIGVDMKAEFHPTQKPVPLMAYMIRTYTTPGQVVLDFTMGSGTTGVAAVLTGRHFIGVEREAKYFEIARERLGFGANDNVSGETVWRQTNIFS